VLTVPPTGGPSAGEPLNQPDPAVTKLKANLGSVLNVLNQPKLMDEPQTLSVLATNVKALHASFEDIKGSNLSTDLKDKCAEADSVLVAVTCVRGSNEFKADGNYKQSHLYEVLSDKANVTKVTNALGALGSVLGAIL